jgi:hypothetical protein
MTSRMIFRKLDTEPGPKARIGCFPSPSPGQSVLARVAASFQKPQNLPE